MNLDDELGSVLTSAARHGLRIILLSIAAGAAVFMWSINQPRKWTSRFTLVPEVELASGPSALANELGLSGATSQGPDFYAEYLRSNEAFYEIARRKYARRPSDSVASSDSVWISDLLEVVTPDSSVRFQKTIEALLRQSNAIVSRRSGLINVSVSLPDPVVAQQVADGLVRAIGSLNDRVRQTKGRLEREFSESRLKLARRELEEAEDSLRNFLERNRQTMAPVLQLERERRERLVLQKQAVMNSVEIAYETARAEEVRNTPRVSVIIPPRVPVNGDPRGTVRRTMVAGVFTFALFTVLYWLADRWGNGSIFRLLWNAIRRLFTTPDTVASP